MTSLSTSQRAGLFAFASLATCLLCAWLLFGRGTSPLQTDVLTLLPATERHHFLEAACAGDRHLLTEVEEDMEMEMDVNVEEQKILPLTSEETGEEDWKWKEMEEEEDWKWKELQESLQMWQENPMGWEEDGEGEDRDEDVEE